MKNGSTNRILMFYIVNIGSIFRVSDLVDRGH
jgi:hypothetical protein